LQLILIYMPKTKKRKYYGVYSKNDNFLHGVFPVTKEGFKLAQAYISKIAPKNKKNYYIEKK